jgi:hypothetical protein
MGKIGVILRQHFRSLAEGSDQLYQLREVRTVLVLRQEHLHRPPVMNRDIQVPVFADDSTQLQEPSVCQIANVGEHRSRINKIEVAIFKGKVWCRCCRGEKERGTQIQLAPVDVLRVDVNTPQLRRLLMMRVEAKLVEGWRFPQELTRVLDFGCAAGRMRHG